MHFSFEEAIDHPQKMVWIDCLGYSGNSLMVSTIATADITDSSPICNNWQLCRYIVGSIKTINLHHFLWMINHFSKREMHENGQDLQQKVAHLWIATSILPPHETTKEEWEWWGCIALCNKTGRSLYCFVVDRSLPTLLHSLHPNKLLTMDFKSKLYCCSALSGKRSCGNLTLSWWLHQFEWNTLKENKDGVMWWACPC